MNKTLYYTFFAIICCIDIILCILLLHKEENKIEQTTGQELMYKSEEEGRAQIYTSDIIDFAFNIGYLLPSDNTISVFVPPYNCSGCVDLQSELINEALAKCPSIKLNYLVPERQKRDFKVKISSSNLNAVVYTYPENSYDKMNDSLKYFDGVIYFAKRSDCVVNIFASNKYFPDLSHFFIERIVYNP